MTFYYQGGNAHVGTNTTSGEITYMSGNGGVQCPNCYRNDKFEYWNDQNGKRCRHNG